MKIHVDDWQFRPIENEVVAVELFLDNGQRAVLEVFPLIYSRTAAAAGCEMVVWCEVPGELLDGGTCKARWIHRAPDASCVWSKVELPPALLEQIDEHLAASGQAAEGPAA
jgi:hypothetical protein